MPTAIAATNVVGGDAVPLPPGTTPIVQGARRRRQQQQPQQRQQQPARQTRDNLHHNRGSHNGDGEDSAETWSRFSKFFSLIFNVSPNKMASLCITPPLFRSLYIITIIYYNFDSPVCIQVFLFLISYVKTSTYVTWFLKIIKVPWRHRPFRPSLPL